MSEESHNVRVTNASSYQRNMPAKRRCESIARNSKLNTWALSSVSGGLSTDTVEELTSLLNSLTSPHSAPPFTSVEDLRNWGNTRYGCKMGDLVATNVPVCCTGCLTNSQEMKAIAETRKGFTELPTHMRWGAHGLTFGSVMLKAFRGTSSNGQSFVKEVKIFVACNNCLDVWVGPIAEGGNRSVNLWPFVPYVPRDNQSKHSQRKDTQSRTKRPPQPRTNRKDERREKQRDTRPQPSKITNESLRFIVNNVQPSVLAGRANDPWKKVTVTMLTSFMKTTDTKPEKLKAHLLSQFAKHCDKDVYATIEAKIAKRGR